jgi:hypothetical protein
VCNRKATEMEKIIAIYKYFYSQLKKLFLQALNFMFFCFIFVS